MFDKSQLTIAIRACDHLLAEANDLPADELADLKRVRFGLHDLLYGYAIACYWTIVDVYRLDEKGVVGEEFGETDRVASEEAREVLKRVSDEYKDTDGITWDTLRHQLYITRREAAKQKA